MSHQLKQRELMIDLATGEWEIRPIGPRINGIHIIGPVDYGWARYLERAQQTGRDDPDILTWGGGPLAGSRIPGTRRLVLCSYSPQWQGFYVSSFGGGAYIMHRVGVDFVSVVGAAPQDSVLILNHRHGEITSRLEPVNPDPLWTGYADPDGERLFGFHALQQAIFDRYSGEYEEDWLRVFATGPAARATNMGIIGSNQVKKRRLLPIEDWAGRGGLGSRMLQVHRLAACIFGGDWEDPDLKDSKEIDGYFRENYGESMIKVDLGAGEKYRYVPGFQTGGTFGVNMHTIDDKLLSFNYASIYQPAAARRQQQQNFIAGHYLQQFNAEIVAPKNFTHCGEPCSVACKKYSGIYKKDYEPYQALGPLCGIFDQRAAEELNHFVDALGIDAIQIGGMASWLMETIRAGLVPPEDFGLPPVGEMAWPAGAAAGVRPDPGDAPGAGAPSSSLPAGAAETTAEAQPDPGYAQNPAAPAFPSRPEQFDVVADSQRNAAYAQKVVSLMVLEDAGVPFRRGLRSAAKTLDERYGLAQPGRRSLDLAVFTAHGDHGHMTPNQYWVPGMFSPMPMMGKYFVYYGLDYLPPRLLGRRCVERMVYELFSENSGVCRFHRKWVEAIVDEIISAHYNFPVDYKAHQFELAKAIYQREGAAVVFWESERTVDLIARHLEGWAAEGLSDPSLLEWVGRFRQDKWAAARAYWDEMRAGIAEAFAAGAEAIPDIVAPYQSAKLEVTGPAAAPPAGSSPPK
jgi:glyceraldehyde-3-phosphate dehydrogenase (ferredoxin)